MRSQFVVGCAQRCDLRVQVGSRQKGCELTSQEIARQASHRDQQNDRDDADEDVRHDQPVTQSPNQPAPREPQQQEETTEARYGCETADPAVE